MKSIIKRMLVGSAGEQALNNPSNLALFDERQLRRGLYFQKLISMIADVPGAIIECGVGQGRGLAVLCSLAALENKDRRLWAFDSFEGFPGLTNEDQADESFISSLKEYEAFDLRYVHNTLLQFGISRSDIDRRISIAKGFIPDSLALYDGQPVAFLHLDLDIYDSYKEALNYFYDLVSPSGIIAFDEYNKLLDVAKWPGAIKAINEFIELRGLKESLIKDSLTGNYYLVKR